jgi:hypothetical protein
MSKHELGRRTARCIAAAAGLVLAHSANAITFDFTTDPGWTEQNNRTDPQNYGFSNTDNTGNSVNPPGGTATGAGEIGGVIRRAGSPINYYAYDLGQQLSLNDSFSASGVIRLVVPDGGSGVNFGFFASGDFYGVGGDANNFVGMSFDDGFNTYAMVNNFDGHGEKVNVPASLNLITGTTLPFYMSYDPSAGDFGELTLMVNNAYAIAPLDNDSRNGLSALLDRFGLFAVSADGAAAELYVDDLTISPGTSITSPPIWRADQSGDWTVSTNWLGGVPNAVDAEAHFLAAITQAQTVYADTGVTAGWLDFDNANTYVLTGAGSLTLDVSTGSAQMSVLTGSHKVNLPLFLNDNTIATVASGASLVIADPMTLVGGSSLTKAGDGTMDIISLVNSPSPASLNTLAGTVNAHLDLGANVTLNAGGGTTNLHSTQHLAAVNVASGARVNVVAGSNKVLVTQSAAIAAGGVVDLNDNDAVINYTGAVGTLVDDTRQAILDGRLTSSAAVTDQTGLGYADNAALDSVKAVFSGENVDPSSILIKFTYLGDSDLDGDVDVADLGKLATSWQSANVWSGGDFDYNGAVDVNDLGKLATNWQAGVGNPLGPSLAEALAAVGLASAAVPEPAGLGLLAVGALAITRRRRLAMR